MNVLKRVGIKSLKLNKKRTIGTIIGIILSASLICAVAGMFQSLRATLINKAIKDSGYFHVALLNVPANEVEELELNREIKEIKKINNLGFSYLENSKKDFPYIEVYSTDFQTFDSLSYEIVEGSYPQNENEIILNKKTITDTGLQIGDYIELEIGERKTEDGYNLTNSNPYNEENPEYIDVKLKRKYKIVGVTTKYSTNYTYWGFTTKEKSEKVDSYIILKNLKNHETIIPKLVGANSSATKYISDTNYELLRWEAFAFSDSTISMFYAILSVVICVIIGVSVFCIRNSFAISTEEKIKMYGMLSSIGATKKQIKKSVIFEGMLLGLIGIPMGLICGSFTVFVLVKVINLISEEILFGSNSEIIFKISWQVILLTSLLSILTIYLSSLSSAKRASRVSPIENIKSHSSIKITSKKLKTPEFIQKLFKTGGVLAYKNLKRSKKKYRTTVISLTVSIIVFISMSVFIEESFGVANRYYTSYDYNIVVSDVRNSETENKIKSLKGIDEIYTISASRYYLKIYDKSKITVNDLLYLECETDYDETAGCPNAEYRSLDIRALDDDSWNYYLKKLNISKEEAKNKGILIDDYKYYEGTKESSVRSYKYNEGETIKGLYNEKELNIELAKTTNIRPAGLENSYYSGGFLIVNKNDFENLEYQGTRIVINTKDAFKLEDEILIIDEDLFITNYSESKKSDDAFKLIFSIFMYGFITVITLIGITNIFNTITSNIELRSKEFAMLKSIGMTKKEFNRMMNLETILYSFKSLLYGIIIGIILSYLIHLSIKNKFDKVFEIPYIPIIISIIFVFLIVFIIMRYSISKVNKKNTIETIRSENI